MVKEQYKGAHAMEKALGFYQSSNYEDACWLLQELYPLLSCNGVYLQYYGKTLGMVGDFEKSIQVLERARCFISDEVLYTNLGIGYDHLKRYSEAESVYKYAFFMVPHKLYPLYLLTKHYEATGQRKKALETARKILEQPVKVKSAATEEIRKEIQELINKISSEVMIEF